MGSKQSKSDNNSGSANNSKSQVMNNYKQEFQRGTTIIGSQNFQVIDSAAQDDQHVKKSSEGFKIDISYFDSPENRSKKIEPGKSFVIKSNEISMNQADQSFREMQSFDFGDQISRTKKQSNFGFFTKYKSDDKKTKIKSYQALLKSENKKIQGSYERKKHQRVNTEGFDQSTSTKFSVVFEGDLKQSKCCHLCNNSSDLKCWRQHLLMYLDRDRQFVVSLEEDEDKFLARQKLDKGWREILTEFVEEQGGSYQDKKWQIEYYDEWKVIGLGDSKDHQSRVNQTQMLMKKKKHPRLNDDEWQLTQAEETGQNAFRLSAQFHEKLLFIKKHLESPMHPIAKIINQFKNIYSQQYYYLLLRNKKVYLKTNNLHQQQDEHVINWPREKLMKNNTDVLKTEILGFINFIVDQVLRFYDIQLKRRDVKRDLFENVVTGLILRDEIYAIMFRLYSEIQEENIQKLNLIQQNELILNGKLSLKSLNINKEFQMDSDYRNEYPLRQNESVYYEDNLVTEGRSSDQMPDTTPYANVVNRLIYIDEIQSPMCKLEHIHKCCTQEIQKTLDLFWANYDVPSKKLAVDVDNLQSLIIYMISRLRGYPQILTNLTMIEQFLPEQVQLSNRAFYLAMMQSSCEYVLDLFDQNEKQEVEDKSRQNIDKIKEIQKQRRSFMSQNALSLDSSIDISRTDPPMFGKDYKPRISSIKAKSIKQDDMPPEQAQVISEEEKNESFQSETEMYTEVGTFYDADNIFFEGNKALKDDERKIDKRKNSNFNPNDKKVKRKLTQVPKLTQLQMMQKMEQFKQQQQRYSQNAALFQFQQPKILRPQNYNK